MFLYQAHNWYSRLGSMLTITAIFWGITTSHSLAQSYNFNMDVLDVEDRENIDLGQFAKAGHIMPGTYTLNVKMNNQSLGDNSITFYEEGNDGNTIACLSPKIVEQFGLKPNLMKELRWDNDDKCLVFSSLNGISATGDLSTSSLLVNVPQAYLEYSSDDWDPPARWDNGLPAVLFDYTLNGSINDSLGGHDQTTYSLTGNGVAGINLGVWRFRGEWQAKTEKVRGSNNYSNHDMDWNRFYVYRALSSLQAKLTIGEDYLQSSIFDSFRFIGASIRTDLNMMPPNMRGYAPEIVGTAKTNATVTVRQQGRVIYETQVAQGPFRIQDLSDVLNGTMNVTVTEQDGSVQQFDVETSNLPYLTRPGQVRYRVALGKPTDYDRNSEGENFASGELSWGVNNGWSVFGGLIGSRNYLALSAGIGRDLLMFGALSADVSQSTARLPGEDRLTGGSYRLSYSKNFEEYNSQITFAGYRFSERNFMTMNDFISAKKSGIHEGGSKELYTLTFSKNFVDMGLTMYLSYNHQTYWNRPENNYYNLMLSKYFNLGRVKNISASLSLNRQVYLGENDDSAYLSLSIPWGDGESIGYSMDARRGGVTNRATYYNTQHDRISYHLSAGENRKGVSTSGFLSYQGDDTWLSVNGSYAEKRYRAVGFNANGGLTLTPKGGGLHRGSQMGGTRLLIDTDGVSGVPIRNAGAPVKSNYFGKAVITDMNSYYRNNIQIDLNNLADDVEAEQSVVQATLTEGAVGYRQLNILSGQKAMVVIRLADGSFPPFGAQVKNMKGQNTGIVADSGNTYLSGIVPKEKMIVTWGDNIGCQLHLQDEIGDLTQSILLPCKELSVEEVKKLTDRTI